MDSIDLLYKLGIRLFKIPSGEITNLPYLRKIASIAEQIVISTGMASMKEIEDALKILTDSGVDDSNITILHCNTQYPTPMKDVNLNSMQTIRDAFRMNTGYSDHTVGIEVPIAAVALGATMIEKHFTLNRKMEGPDHMASLEPEELKAMTIAIRNIEKALGSPIKTPSPSEIENINVARKSIHSFRAMHIGDVIEASDLIMLRPGDGISPMKMDDIIGLRLKKDIPEGYKFLPEDLLE
jgi:sialic acid synthase SpsE